MTHRFLKQPVRLVKSWFGKGMASAVPLTFNPGKGVSP